MIMAIIDLGNMILIGVYDSLTARIFTAGPPRFRSIAADVLVVPVTSQQEHGLAKPRYSKLRPLNGKK